MDLEEAIAHAKEVAETVSCKECAEDHRQLAEWLKELKAHKENACDDAISRKATLEKFKKTYFDNETVIRCAELVINGMPPVTPQPKIGHWIFDDERKEHGHCSECGYGSVDLVDGKPHNYCPNCGRKMEEF